MNLLALEAFARCRLATRHYFVASRTSLPMCLGLLAFVQLGQTCLAGELRSVNTAHMVSGSVIENEREIIVEGGKFVVEGEQKTPVISIDSRSGKKVILNGVEIIARNASFRSDGSAAGLVVINNENDDSQVVIKKLRVRARNVTVKNTATGDSSCAAAICYQAGRYDSTRAMTVSASGQTNISASQGQRPDYRKVPAR